MAEGPLGAPRPLSTTTLKVKVDMGIDGRFPPQNIQSDFEEALRSRTEFDLGVEFKQQEAPEVQLFPPNTLFVITVIAETGQTVVSENDLEAFSEPIRRQTAELGFDLTGDLSSVIA